MFLCCVLLFESLLIAVAPPAAFRKRAKNCRGFFIAAGPDRFLGLYGPTIWPSGNILTRFTRRLFSTRCSLYLSADIAAGISGVRSARVVGIQPFTALKITLLIALLGTWGRCREVLPRITARRCRNSLFRVSAMDHQAATRTLMDAVSMEKSTRMFWWPEIRRRGLKGSFDAAALSSQTEIPNALFPT